MSIYLSKFRLQLCCQGIEVKLPMGRAFHLRVASLTRLDENIVSDCRNVCVFANDVGQSALLYLVQHGPGEWPDLWTSSVPIEEAVTIHKGFELTTDDTGKGWSDDATSHWSL